jgi:hypothetical protein
MLESILDNAFTILHSYMPSSALYKYDFGTTEPILLNDGVINNAMHKAHHTKSKKE